MKTSRVIVTVSLLINSITAFANGVVDIEYVPAKDGYEEAFGVGFYQVKEEGFGFYGNIQATLSDREPKYDSLNIYSFGDPVMNRYQDLLIGNIGITKKLASVVGLYGGIGYASATGVAEKFDPMYILASDGVYYVDDPENDDSGVNVNIGMLLLIERLALNVGYHSFTKSTYFGIGGKF